jgi:hypothetical protein
MNCMMGKYIIYQFNRVQVHINLLSFNFHFSHPEYMFQRYTDVKFLLRCSERRRLDKCYKKWNKMQ